MNIITQPNDEIASQIKQYADSINITIPETVEECWEEAKTLEKEVLVSFAKQGMIFLKLKKESPFGEFQNRLEEEGFNPKAAQRAMAVANMLLNLPESKTTTSSFLSLNKSQLIELAGVDVDIIQKIPEDEIAEAAKLAVRPFQKRIKELEEQVRQAESKQGGEAAEDNKQGFDDPRVTELDAQLKRAKADLAVSEEDRVNAINELERLRLTKQQSQTQFGLPESIAGMRNQAICAGALIDNLLVSTELHVAALGSHMRETDAEGLQKLGASRAIYHSFLPVAERIYRLLGKIRDYYPDEIKGPENYPSFSADEWGHIEQNREHLHEVFQADLLAAMANKAKGGK